MSVLNKLPFGARPHGGSSAPTSKSGGLPPAVSASPEEMVDLERRRDDLSARVAELQWDLGGLVYEMAVRDRIRVEVLVQRAATLQEADAELSEVERILRTEQTATAGKCATCGVPHSSGAVYCWQCGSPLLVTRPAQTIGAR
ncbi:MAG: hypothetical protein AAGC46_08880 [Solirubrobacteraceae bacterium]|nr:hypothetical protein [Patulibacter sp.]